MRSLETSHTYFELNGSLAGRELPSIGEPRRLLRFVRRGRHGGLGGR